MPRKVFKFMLDEDLTSCREELRNFYNSTNLFWGDNMKETEMGGVCNTHERNETFILKI